jgi:GcrA cell cycle regulator
MTKWGTNNVGGRPAKMARSAVHRQEREALWKDNITTHDRQIPKSQRRTLRQLTPFTCRFPIGDPRDKKFFFCGALAPFYTYCDHHYKIAWTKPRRP